MESSWKKSCSEEEIRQNSCFQIRQNTIYYTNRVLLVLIDCENTILARFVSKNVRLGRRRATFLLSTWIYSCRFRWTVSFALPFTTNVTISTPLSQTFNSWVAISHLRPPMVFISQLRQYAMVLLLVWVLYLLVIRQKLFGQDVRERLKSYFRKLFRRYLDLIKQYLTLRPLSNVTWPLRFGWLFVLSLYKDNYLQIFKCVYFWLHGCCGEWERLGL